MFDRFFAKPAAMPIGCALSENALRLIQLDTRSDASATRSATIQAAVVEPLELLTPDNVVAWRASLAKALDDALAKGDFIGRDVVLSLPWCQMGYRRLRLASMPQEELATAVQWRAAKELAVPINTFVSSFYDVGQTQDQGRRCLDVIAVTASATDVELAVNALDQAGLTTLAVDAGAGALARALASNSRAQQSCLVLEVGVCSSCVMVISHGQPCYIRTIPGGRQQIVQRTASRLGLEVVEHGQLWQLLDGRESQQTDTPTIHQDDERVKRMLTTLNEVASLHAAELAHEVILCTHYMAGLCQGQNPNQNPNHVAGEGDLSPQQGCIVGAGAQEEIFLSKIKDACDVAFYPLEQMLGASLGMALESLAGQGSIDSWLTAAGLSFYDIKALSRGKCA